MHSFMRGFFLADFKENIVEISCYSQTSPLGWFCQLDGQLGDEEAVCVAVNVQRSGSERPWSSHGAAEKTAADAAGREGKEGRKGYG